MKDFLGNELKVGDQVVWSMKTWPKLELGTIVKLTAKRVHITRPGSSYPEQVRLSMVMRMPT